MASLLHASMCGDQGEVDPSQVKVPSASRMTITLSAATGRRRTLFSPVPEINGKARRMTMMTIGATRIMKVSV